MRSKDESLFPIIIEYVNRYYDNNSRSPSTREIESATGISRPTVQRYLSTLKERGEIEYDGHRGIITDYIREALDTGRVSVGSSIHCGPLTEAEEYRSEHIRLPKELTGDGEFHLLRAVGDSMINAGIDEGDRVLIRLQSSAKRGDIIACLYDSDKTTLKRYCPEADKIILKPENDAYEPICIRGKDRERFVIQGVATMVLKML